MREFCLIGFTYHSLTFIYIHLIGYLIFKCLLNIHMYDIRSGVGAPNL
jgi:hypothetical protein